MSKNKIQVTAPQQGVKARNTRFFKYLGLLTIMNIDTLTGPSLLSFNSHCEIKSANVHMVTDLPVFIHQGIVETQRTYRENTRFIDVIETNKVLIYPWERWKQFQKCILRRYIMNLVYEHYLWICFRVNAFDNKSILDQTMALGRLATRYIYYLSQNWLSFMSLYGVSTRQWIQYKNTQGLTCV